MIFTQKQPGCKKGQPCSKWLMWKKVLKSKGAAKKWWYRLMTNFNSNSGESVLILGWGNTNWPELLLLNFCCQLYYHSHFLAAPFDFTTFHTGCLNRATPFFTSRLFYSTAVLYIRIIKVWDFLPKKHQPKTSLRFSLWQLGWIG